jgi:hypothetical protein
VPRNDRLLDHVPLTGHIERPGDFARYPIVAQQGDVFTVGVSPVSGSTIQPTIELYDPSGELVAQANAVTSDAGGDALIAAYPAGETGTYVALVQGQGNSTGDYVISYGIGSSRENVMRGEGEADVSLSGEVVRAGLRDVWSIYLNKGDVITATVNPNTPSFDPALDLVAPDGSTIAADDNGGGGRVPLIAGARAPESGLYMLGVSGSNGLTGGGYTLVWRYVSAAPTATPPAASILVLSADDVLPEQTYLFYPFQGQQGQHVLVRVTAQRGSGLDPVAALLDSDGNVLAQADDNGQDMNPILEFVLPYEGTFTVRVNGYGESTGAFDVTVEALY